MSLTKFTAIMRAAGLFGGEVEWVCKSTSAT